MINQNTARNVQPATNLGQILRSVGSITIAATSILMGCAVPASAGGFCLATTVVDDTMVVNATGYDQRISNGVAYSQDCTSFYTVDILVPSSYTIPGIGNAINIGAGTDQLSLLNENNCATASESLVIYKRTGLGNTWTPWNVVISQSVKGTWVPSADSGDSPHCVLTVPVRVNGPTKMAAVDQYRVLVLPKISGMPIQAMIFWEWTY